MVMLSGGWWSCGHVVDVDVAGCLVVKLVGDDVKLVVLVVVILVLVGSGVDDADSGDLWP